MQKVSYMGNGETTEFNFNFPYFENDNIVVTMNNQTAPSYTIVGTSGGADADFPYTGGKVVFETAPSALDSIVIARNLPLTRVIDYQPLAKIDPTTLNRDMNYTMEILKDLQDEFDTLSTQYADITDNETAQILLAKINTLTQQITALGDITTLRQSVTTNTENITTLSGNLGTIDTRTTGLNDYVVAFQAPTAENNYTWYRKYKSGWVEIGGQDTMSSTSGMTITLPVEMADTNYNVYAHILDDSQSGYVFEVQIKQLTVSSFNVREIASYNNAQWVSDYKFNWLVFGFCA